MKIDLFQARASFKDQAEVKPHHQSGSGGHASEKNNFKSYQAGSKTNEETHEKSKKSDCKASDKKFEYVLHHKQTSELKFNHQAGIWSQAETTTRDKTTAS